MGGVFDTISEGCRTCNEEKKLKEQEKTEANEGEDAGKNEPKTSYFGPKKFGVWDNYEEICDIGK